MKNQMVKRMLAGSMAIVVGAGCIGAYEYNQSHGQPGATVYAEEDVERLKEAAEDVLDQGEAAPADGFYKEEAVYVKTDASGKAETTTVTEWLKHTGDGEVSDVTELENIENIKGDEKFTKEGGTLTWKAEGEDIYYQGTTDKELPVEVKVSYRLDGKDISADKLKGKDGKVEIRIEYVNKLKETVSVNGEDTELYAPFTMVTALMLPTEEYKNVEVDHGRIVSDAEKDIVLGLAFPGLKENLKLSDIDVDIPESVTITADVKNASVGPTITVASADVMDQLGLDEISDFDGLEDSVASLSDAADKLTEGSRDAADGSRTLADGAGTLDEKGTELVNGVNSIADGVSKYTGGVSSLASGGTKVADGARSVQEGAKNIQGGIAGAKTGAEELQAGIGNFGDGVTAAMGDISGGLSNVDSALQAALNALSGSGGTISADVVPTKSADAIVANAMAQVPGDLSDEQAAQVRNALTAAVQEAYNSQKAVVTQSAPSAADASVYIQNAKAGIGAMQTSISNKSTELSAGLTQLKDGSYDLASGLGQLSDGSAALVTGTEELVNGAQALSDGANTLNTSGSVLTDGVLRLQKGSAQLASGTGQLRDGADALAEGNESLADGMSEFKTSGIDKLTEVFDGDIRNVTERIDAMSEVGRNYTSFAGIKEGTPGSTKFIIETRGAK